MGLLLSKGDIIQMGKEKYDVLRILEEIDKYDVETNAFVGEHTAIEFHQHGSSSLHPTHLLKLYYDKEDEAVVFEIVQEKPPNGIEKYKERGNIFKYLNKKVIPSREIKILSKK